MKYKLTKETREVFGITLYRIKALKDFGNIKNGDLGGWIEKETNLSQKDLCWVSDNACVSGNARIASNARVSGDARIFGGALIFDNACVSGGACVFSNVRIYGDAWISGNALILDNACVSGNARVSKDVINLTDIGYNVIISDNYMQIGCENHPFDYWLNLKKKDILQMGGKEGIKFAKVHKKYLKKLIKNR